jgi:hypothetical protein
MREEIKRILALVKNGTLTEEQGAELIKAIADKQSKDGAGKAKSNRSSRNRRDGAFGEIFEQVFDSQFSGNFGDLAAEVGEAVSQSGTFVA